MQYLEKNGLLFFFPVIEKRFANVFQVQEKHGSYIFSAVTYSLHYISSHN